MKLLTDGYKNSVIIDAVNKLKNGEFKATAIKVELEAQLDRGRDNDNCEYCNEGYQDCNECSGGDYYCDDCDGSGVVENSNGEEVECHRCEGNGRITCEDCGGEGNVTCPECGGDWEAVDGYGSNHKCHDFILERLVPLGLAEAIPSGEYYQYADRFRPKLPLVFSKFYNDGSVDSEHTFTLMLDNPENVFLLPKILEVFTLLHEEINGDRPMQVEGAGMHIALLNSENGYYEKSSEYASRYSPHLDAFMNYRSSMQMLLPALFFLGSSNETSRRLNFRTPRIERGDEGNGKYHAVNFAYGALEFRLFETCYDNPEAILDMVCVISNSMKYWRKKFIPFRMKGISRVYFGNDKDRTLKRFYMHRETLEVLNGGLRILKPSYYTIREVKQQRNFHTTKATIDNSIKRQRKDVELEYKEYEQRFQWRLEIRRYDHMSYLMDRKSTEAVKLNRSPLEYTKEVEKEVDELIEKQKKEKKSVAQYVKERLEHLEQSNRGMYCLESK